MSWGELGGPLAYVIVFLATVIEGEIVFVAATVLVQAGRLDALGVYAAAALGGSIGDQLYFYALRGRLAGWLDRFPTWRSRRDRVIPRVRRHMSTMVLACRFLPGLRVAIPAACACADVPPGRFSLLSLLSSAAWAGAVMGVIAWLGPRTLEQLGVRGWWTPVVPGLLVLAFGWWLNHAERAADESSSG